MKRAARFQTGSLVFNRRFGTWNFLWCENGHRRSKVLGTLRQFPAKALAWRAAEPLKRKLMEGQVNRIEPGGRTVPTVSNLVAQYRDEKMPQRFSTKRGYQSWLDNHIVPQWGEHPLTDLQARPVELWLQTLQLAPKSKLHIRGILSILWDYAMWRGDVPTERNPMQLVSIKGATKRIRKPRSLTVEQFHALLNMLGTDPCWRTMLLLSVSFGLHISEVLGLKWKDVDWLGKTISIQRGVVKQVVDEVKTAHSAKTKVIADGLLGVLKQWKQTTQFSSQAGPSAPELHVRLGDAERGCNKGRNWAHQFSQLPPHASDVAGLCGHTGWGTAEAHAPCRHPYHDEPLR